VKNVSVRFALFINDSSPPPAIVVSFPKNFNNIALLSFKRSPASDVDRYVVYYSSDVQLDSPALALDSVVLDLSNVLPSDDLVVMAAHTDRFYYNPSTETFYKPVQVSVTKVTGERYNFAVVGVDKDGNQLHELTSFSTVLFPS
jgi:hypothetical protein